MFQKLTDPTIAQIDIEICFVCKKCRMAFPGESPLLTHQRQCYGINQKNRGAFRIVQSGYECKSCKTGDRFKSSVELRKHLESEAHGAKHFKGRKPIVESPLSHEMDDVVNQIALLAASAAKESGQHDNFDGDAKRRFLSPADVAPLATSIGH